MESSFDEYVLAVEDELIDTGFFKVVALIERIIGVEPGCSYDSLTPMVRKGYEGGLTPVETAHAIMLGMMDATYGLFGGDEETVN